MKSAVSWKSLLLTELFHIWKTTVIACGSEYKNYFLNDDHHLCHATFTLIFFVNNYRLWGTIAIHPRLFNIHPFKICVCKWPNWIDDIEELIIPFVSLACKSIDLIDYKKWKFTHKTFRPHSRLCLLLFQGTWFFILQTKYENITSS
jgi:hypothetical protein